MEKSYTKYIEKKKFKNHYTVFRKFIEVFLNRKHMELWMALHAGNALARVQRVHKPADLWDITFCTR